MKLAGRPESITRVVTIDPYHRKFNAGMAMTLICMFYNERVHKPQGGWMNVNHIRMGNFHASQSREVCRAVFWGLVEEKPNQDPTKKRSGIWRLTNVGKAFVKNEVTIFSHVWLLENVFKGFTGTQVSISQLRGSNKNKFDYPELMRDSGLI